MAGEGTTGSGSVRLVIIVQLLSVAVIGGAIYWGNRHPVASAPPAAWTVEKQREWAGKLLARGLKDEAIDVYERLISSGALEPAQIAPVSLSIARLHAERQRFEKAVAALDRAAMTAPNDDLRGEINRLLVECLERLGRSSDAAFELKKAASPSRQDADGGDGSVVLAEAGDTKVTRRDLEDTLRRLPASAASQMQDRESRKSLVQSLLAARVLYSKAKNLGLDKDPAVRSSIDDAEKQIVVSRLLKDEVAPKITIDPKDVENYYQARHAHYEDKPFADVKSQVDRDYRREKEQAAVEEFVDAALHAAGGRIHDERIGGEMPASAPAKATESKPTK